MKRFADLMQILEKVYNGKVVTTITNKEERKISNEEVANVLS
jgi:translation initiation factor 1 (eIF-1/SUI1)